MSEPPSGQYRVYGYRWVVLGVGLLVNLIQLFGQVSVVFVYVMAALRTADGPFTVSLVLASGLLIVGAIASSRLKDAAPAAAPAGESTVV